jgi:phosphoribosylanthranilate isomerase
MSPVRVKICGITCAEDARCARAAGAWAIGLNFFPKSPRCVTPARAVEIVAAAAGMFCVGVFVNEERERVQAIADEAGLHALQFHGDENPAYCAGWSLPVIKAIRVRDEASVVAAGEFPVAYVLADAWAPDLYGGSGRTFAWELLRPLDRDRLILAGGLDPGNVAAAVRAVRPFAVDVASGVESEPGRKDPEKVRRFVDHALHA